MIIGSNDLFYNTIGKIDSLVVKIVSSIINIGSFDCVKIYRDGFKYIGTKLVLSFDNKLFVDIRIDCNTYDFLYEGMNSFINIFNNTLNLDCNSFKFIMLNLVSDGQYLYENYLLSSNFSDIFIDKFSIVIYNFGYLGKMFLGSNNLDWLVFLNASNYSELVSNLNSFFFHPYEKKVLIYLLNFYWAQ